MQSRVFDLHCDTLSELYDMGLPWKNGTLHLNADAAAPYAAYRQVFAIYSRNSLPDEECWRRYCEMVQNTLPRLMAEKGPSVTVYLGVEGGKLLGDDLSRLDTMYRDGVRILTLVWGGHCKVGGAHDTHDGLTPFGEQVVRRCFELGIVPDISHASDEIFFRCAELAREAGKPFIASHSNSRALCHHSRDLTDEMFRAVCGAGGIVGISLCRQHLTDDPEKCDVGTVADHVCHYLELGGEKTVCLGCDLDGTAPLPDGIRSAADLWRIADKLCARGIAETTVDDIFFGNAAAFFTRCGIEPIRN